jgi:hypothetical protein
MFSTIAVLIAAGMIALFVIAIHLGDIRDALNEGLEDSRRRAGEDDQTERTEDENDRT